MDQKEIDALINQGSVAEFNKKQEDILRHMVDKSPSPVVMPTSPAQETITPDADPDSPSPGDLTPDPDKDSPAGKEEKKGKVMGQLSRVTEESEAGTNMVMGFMENVLTVVSRQQSFIKDMTETYAKNPGVIDIYEAFSYVNDNLTSIEELIFSAMDAFQFQDIGRQKLMKVMYTLAKLNEYLNELLGGDAERTKAFGHRIEKKTLEQDKDKAEVENIIASYQPDKQKSSAAPSHTDSASNPVPTPHTNAETHTYDKGDVDSIVSQFKEQKEQSTTVENKDIDSIIAEFQKQNR